MVTGCGLSLGTGQRILFAGLRMQKHRKILANLLVPLVKQLVGCRAHDAPVPFANGKAKALVTDTLDCGNFYVNRDVVGAVVESQPFGGHGLSGNGAKAGSEHYLEQFVARKVVCEDTTAAGGNLELMRTTG